MKRLAAFTLCLALLPQVAPAQGRCDGPARDVTTTPAPPDNPEALRAARDLLAAQPGKADIVLVGDSLMVGWQKGLATDFPGKSVWNFAVVGDRMQQVIWRLDRIRRPDFTPQAVMILIGTNSMGVRGLTACALHESILVMLRKLRRHWPAVPMFVMTIPPRGADFRAADETRRELNALILSGAAQGGYTAVPLDDMAMTCGAYGQDPLPQYTGICHPDEAYRCGNYASDNTHLQPPAYRLLRAALRRASVTAHGRDLFD